MKKIIAMTMGGLALTFAMLILQAPASAGNVVSLRGDNGIPSNIDAPKLFKTEEPEKLFPRAHEGTPPLIPHVVDYNENKYKITLKTNGCLDCHDKSVSDKPKSPKANKGHYTGPNGVIEDEIYKSRYYCAQCHVPQLKTKPLVENTFVGSQ
jgi:cytochrome c-type protein NapB